MINEDAAVTIAAAVLMASSSCIGHVEAVGKARQILGEAESQRKAKYPTCPKCEDRVGPKLFDGMCYTCYANASWMEKP